LRILIENIKGNYLLSDLLPLVSIITPAYNRADYLEGVILSVLNQDYPNIEYIVLDDGSKDNTVELLKKYTGKLIWESHTNMGETRTVNKGWGMAKGEIVAVINSDDPLLPGAVRAAVDFMQAYPDLLVAYPDWVKIDPTSKVFEEVHLSDYDYVYMVRRHHCIVGPGAFFRRKAFLLTEMRDPSFKYVADFEYWFRLGLYGPFGHIPQTLATFRVHPDSASVSQKGARMAAEHLQLMDKFYALPGLPTEIRKIRNEAYCWACIVAGGMCGSNKKDRIAYYLRAFFYYPKSFIGRWLFQNVPVKIISMLKVILKSGVR
jgi:glycosyltransferase involved in cell wall biosynthesis